MSYKFCLIDDGYMDFLRRKDRRIPYNDYGDDHYKPFFRTLFKKGDLSYVACITSPKAKHRHMKTSKDFKKVFIDTNKQRGRFFVGAINLNHMFPVPSKYISNVNFEEIDKVRTFRNSREKSKYISLLKHELESMSKMDLSEAAKELYNYKYSRPETSLAKRCLDFKELEKEANLYK